MLLNTQSLKASLTIESEALEFVERFTYSGSFTSSDCGVTDEVNAQICKDRVAFGRDETVVRCFRAKKPKNTRTEKAWIDFAKFVRGMFLPNSEGTPYSHKCSKTWDRCTRF
ncbi:hypothetical protein CLF_101749 [Clonorchis sinensis]|uniref:Uncharacterized protein n=1 Tax=Clonorchis sinensis TaxID=79923 RepID=H2KPC7_CLOSI|nr:hypothetical protein CLF_101749 [Clonorchis sinensis]